MSSYIDQLNDAQKQAVLATEGPMMVIAGAGSGKTRVLTYRIAHLMEKGVDSFQILSLTFTNKAAREMKERIASIVGESEAKNLWMGTFHSVFARILRIEGDKLGYPSNFTIYDSEDSLKVISALIKENNLDKDIYKPKSVQGRISSYKNNLITPKAYQNRPDLQENDATARMPMIGQLYTAYTERCFRAGAMDFDDLLLKTNELLHRFPDVLAKYQERFKYILVDEYQDTNHSQYLIVKALASRFENVCVVGDDAQSIYAFRGANIRNILNFQKDYPDAKIFKLEQNYRSTKNIVEAANSIIAKNRDQLEKNVWTSNDKGEQIVVHKAVSDSDEGNWVASNIFESHQNTHEPWSSFCILYRTNSQSRAFEDAFRKRNIPYRIYGGLSFYQRKEIKDLMAYFRLAINHSDEEAFRRVINYPARGIGQTTMDRLINVANSQEKSIWDIAENIYLYPTGINKPTQQRILDFVERIKSYGVLASKHDAFDVAAHIAKTSGLIKAMSEDKTPEGVTRTENIQELLNGIKDFSEEQKQIEDGDVSLAYYLQDIALLTDADKDNPEDMNKVNLMTIHLAKGLEFPYVYIVGMEENLFPSMMSMNTRSDLEEERRLFYVALTRAEKRAYLTYAHVRYRWGKLIDCEPSRFIEEIDERFLDIRVPEFGGFYSPPDEVKAAFDSPQSKTVSRGNDSFGGKPRFMKKQQEQKPIVPPKKHQKLRTVSEMNDSGEASNVPDDLEKGTRVVHDRFGLGTVKEITGSGADRKAIIFFDNAGEKRLLLKFAKLQKARKS
ncbi:MAG: UvrD-helicase domain-containing protein [Flavobacteriia bacterium]|nr:UvrD-helicase domain-containing protein [Flavobacteriia bacterium]